MNYKYDSRYALVAVAVVFIYTKQRIIDNTKERDILKNACVVGYGAVGPVHAYAISNTCYANLYAVCDIDKKRAKSCADEYGCRVYYSFDEMLKDEKVDVVHICTPHYLHKEMVLKSLKNGKSVVLEKPVALNRAEFNEIMDYVRRHDAFRRICVMMQNRTNNCIVKMKDIMQNDKSIGNLLGIVGMMNWHRDEAYYNHDEWRGKWNTEGGGIMINQAVHLLDMMLYFGGSVKKIHTNTNHWKIKNIEVEDTAQALIEFENGVNGVFQATNCYVTDEPYYLDLRFQNRHLRYADGFLYDITTSGCDILAKDDSVKIGKSYWGNGHNNVVDSFYRSENGDNAEYTNISDAAATMETLYCFYDGGSSK